MERASRSPASSWLVLLVSQAQHLHLQKRKSCGARGFQIPLSIDSEGSPETFFFFFFFRLAPHPTPSADESARKGRSRGTRTSSSSSRRDQPCRKETSAAYLLCRKQAQPTAEKHGQRPTRAPDSSFVSNLLRTHGLMAWNALSFSESCFYVVQESGLRIPLYRAFLVISDASSQKKNHMPQSGVAGGHVHSAAGLSFVQLLSQPPGNQSLMFLSFFVVVFFL